MRRVRVMAALLAVATTACGPDVDIEGFVKREKVDIVLGEREQKAAEARPPGANPVHLGFPSFVAPPPVVALRPGPSGSTVTTAPPPPPPACPKALPTAFAVDVAGGTIDVPPKQGVYSYRREGRATVAGVVTELSPLARRQVSEVSERTSADGAVIRRFAVSQHEGGLQQPGVEESNTKTVYEADHSSPTRPTGVGVTAEEAFSGLKIVSVTTESAKGVDSFNPATPVRIATLPFLVEGGYWGDEPEDRNEQGADPLTGARMAVQHRTVSRVTIDVCGTLHQAWRVAVQGEFGAFGGDSVFFTSKVDFAPQLGGIVLRDELVLSDGTPSDENGDGEWELKSSTGLHLTSVSTLTSTSPEQP